jgi:hypothetical protein
MEPGAVIEGVAPASVGAGRLQLDSKFLVVEPQVVGADYGDILMVDSDSPSYDLFEAEGDSLRTDVGEAFKESRKSGLSATSWLTHDRAAAGGGVGARPPHDSSALVTVDVNEDEIVKVVEAGAVANATPAVKALTGKPTSAKGFKATYGYQLLFLVPSRDTGGKIVLLGYTQGLVAASELP